MVDDWRVTDPDLDLEAKPKPPSDRAFGAAAGFGAAWILVLAWLGAEYQPYLELYAEFQGVGGPSVALPTISAVTLSTAFRLGAPVALGLAFIAVLRRTSPWWPAAVAAMAFGAVVLSYYGATAPIRALAEPILAP